MNLLSELSTQVLIGVERRQPTLPAAPGLLGELLIEVANSTPAAETQVLRTAGAIGVCALAGYQPSPTDEAAMPVCPAETRRIPTHRSLISALRHIFDDGPERLRVEALRRLADAGCCAPPRLLLGLLQHGKNTPALRPFMAQAVGQRGRWLAELNPEWRYLAPSADETPDPQIWETGALDQRRQFIVSTRRRDPAQARTLFSAGLAEMDARERARLLAAMQINLSADDEDLLESLLRDRSKEVRQVAADLLSRLPESRYVQRMIERLTPCLKHERKLLRRKWTLEPPEQFGADWKQDALEENRVQGEVLGDRAWWLYQIARAIPLAWWEQHTELSAAELMQWAKGSDWSLALLRAWHEALLRERNAVWAESLLEQVPPKKWNPDLFELIAVLPASRRESHWLRLLETGVKSHSFSDVLGRIAASLPLDSPMLSADFARQAIQIIKNNFLQNDYARWDYSLRTALPELICLFPAEVFAEITEGWPMDKADNPLVAETAARVLAMVKHRQALDLLAAGD
ncbi:MAG: hypothetical protein HC889_04705 [Synechococcaceae cyanobacterium SM1_2_3]|nr:hypothetical protein [Synechococcaceae cyanobacterium SM1_2_3]